MAREKEDFSTSLAFHGNVQNLTGRVFGHLTVLRALKTKRIRGYVVWLCQCDCGRRVKLPSGQLPDRQYCKRGCPYSEGGFRAFSERKHKEVSKAGGIASSQRRQLQPLTVHEIAARAERRRVAHLARQHRYLLRKKQAVS